jgi:hypothetical protein
MMIGFYTFTRDQEPAPTETWHHWGQVRSGPDPEDAGRLL